jgi:hypothetical protein
MPELSVNQPAPSQSPAASASPTLEAVATTMAPIAARPREIGGPQGPEPTRYGDWEKSGRCIDF